MIWRLAVVGMLATGAAQAADQELVERGQALLQRNCASCHAIGKEGASPLPAAPAFRTIKERYPIEDLAEPLAEGIETGHPQMPTRAFAAEDVDAILAYLATL